MKAILLILAGICFLLAAFDVALFGLSMVPAGLLFWLVAEHITISAG